MDVGPGAVSTLLIAKVLNIPVPNYFVGYQLRIYFLSCYCDCNSALLVAEISRSN